MGLLQKPPTLTDVARSAGVSPYTVSVVLNGARSNTRVSEATRKRICDTAAVMQYHPNRIARSLARRCTKTLGVVVGVVESASALANEYASSVLQGVVTGAAASSYDVLLYTEVWKDRERSAPRFRDGRCDGIVLVAPLTDTDVVEGLATIGVPLVAISADPNHIPANVASIDVDNVVGIEIAVEHLWALGHRRIAHLMGDPNVASVEIRRRAFRAALLRADLPCPPEYLTSCTYDARTVPDAVRALLEMPDRPTAIVAGNDKIAMAAVAAARAAGLSVPRHLSVIGFDDIEAASHLTPALTTVRQPLTEIGEAAARCLIRGLEGDSTAYSQRRLIEPTLIVRGSTAAVSDAGQ